MIKSLEGIHETVHFSKETRSLLYINQEAEDFPIHWHAACEIIMPLENSYRVVAADVNYELKVNDILVIAPGVLHQLFAPASGRRVIFQNDFTMLYHFKDLESIFSFQPLIFITEENSPGIHRDIFRLMLEIIEEYGRSDPLVDASIHAKLMNILVLLGRNYTEHSNGFQNVNNTKQKEYVDRFLLVCDHINQHCTEDLSLETIAHYAGFSKYHFTRLFKQFTNLSFYRYLCKSRIRRAETLLIDPHVSITEVWIKSGFSSQATFNRVFRDFKNCTPTEFRQLISSERTPYAPYRSVSSAANRIS